MSFPIAGLILFAWPSAAVQAASAPLIDLYRDLHAHPELSYGEDATSRRIADELRQAGFTVTEHVGKYADPKRTAYGVVGVLANGKGRTILVRTDMDALPVEEKTGLAFASRARAKDDTGEEVPVMHACGHDMHMTVFVGTARALAAAKDTWKGTLVFVGQPAEERAPGGAQAMLADGLYTRFPKPDACLALHCDANRKVGEIGYLAGAALANVDTVDITVRGVGGHGAYPQSTKDPVVLAAQIVLDLQTIVSREIAPGEPAVVTVGSIHGGTKHNIIPDEVKLQLTVRSYTDATRRRVLAAIQRIVRGAAVAAGIPEGREPIVDLHDDLLVPATYNDPALVKSTVDALRTELGGESVVEAKPVMGGEDFGHFSLPDHSLPCFMLWLGTVDPARVAESAKSGVALPSLHSSAFAPVAEPAIATGVRAMTAAVTAALKPGS
jgi:hippurate hydrolase